MKYKCDDVFMIRAPTLPIDSYLELFEFNDIKDNISKFISDEDNYNFLNEGLIVASKSLHKSFNSDMKSKKKEKSYNLSLLKYIIRASTRPTPYGLFAGVALGKLSDLEMEDNIVIDKNKCIRDVKVDTYWICHLIHELEKDHNILSKLSLQFNTICYKYGDRFKNPYFANHGGIDNLKDYVQENNIKHSPLIDIIKENSRSFISYEDLKYRICEIYEGIPQNIVDNTLRMLVENEYLLTNLRLPAYCNDSLKHVIEIVGSNEMIEDVISELKKLQKSIEIYSKSENAFMHIETIESIYMIMEKMYKSKDYLEVNRGLTLEQNNLPVDLKKRIERFANYFSKIAVDIKDYTKLDKFTNEFSESYGSNVEVSLKEIIDPNGFDGLSLIEAKLGLAQEKENKIKRIVDNRILSALMSNEIEINLHLNDFKKVMEEYPEDTRNKSIKSFDINLFITKIDNEYNIVIGPNKGSIKAGSMFQRFASVFDEKLSQEYNEIYEDEINISKDEYILVESRGLAQSGRSNNVTNRFKNHNHYLPIALTEEDTSDQIVLDDLLIGLSRDRKLYIKSKNKNRVCKIVNDNMLNTTATGKILNLLMEISSEYEERFIDRLYFLFENKYVYIPRINFEGITIQPRRWVIPFDRLELDTLKEFKESFKKCQYQYKIDKLVYLCEYDNRLIVDTEREEFIEIIYSVAKKNGSIELCELEKGLFEGSIVRDKKGRKYVSEMVFSCILDKKEHEINKLNQESYVKNNMILQTRNRIFPPFKDGWIYMKLYGIGNRENEVLKSLFKILEILSKPMFFYLRYFDEEGKHLRIRFKFNNEEEALEKMLIINDWLWKLQEKSLINRWILDVYKREINRYGGIELIGDVENIFYKDSQFTINILNLFNVEEEKELEKIYIIGLCTMLKELTESKEDMFKIIDSNYYHEAYRDKFRKNRRKYMDMIENILNNKPESIDTKILEVKDSLISRKETLKYFSKSLSIVLNNKKNANYRNDIILSLMHMYCNRLTGIKNHEEQYLAIIRHALYSHLEKKKYMGDIETIY